MFLLTYVAFLYIEIEKEKKILKTFILWKHFISIQKIYPGFQWTIFISDLKFLPVPQKATEATLKTCLNAEIIIVDEAYCSAGVIRDE